MAKRKSHAGAVTTIMTLSVFLLGLMMASIAVDVGVYFNTQNMMQTAANAGALAGIDKLVKSKTTSASQRQTWARETAQQYVAENATDTVPFASDSNDIVFGYADPDNKVATSSSIGTTAKDGTFQGTGGVNVIQVTVARKNGKTGGQIPTLLAKMLGITGTDATATAIAMADSYVSAISAGVRPIYACDAQWKLALQKIDQGLASPLVRIYSDRFQILQNNSWVNVTSGCPPIGTGNWGFADFRDASAGSVGASTTAEWFRNGYPGKVKVGDTYSTKPGNFISAGQVSGALDYLIANKVESFIPVVPQDKFLGSGSNTQVQPSAFVGFIFTGYKANGSESSRYVEGYYLRKTCNGDSCSTDKSAAEAGAIKTRLITKM